MKHKNLILGMALFDSKRFDQSKNDELPIVQKNILELIPTLDKRKLKVKISYFLKV